VRYFIDSEFREDGKIIDLISIALVAEDGREFYGISTAARLDLCDSWLRENVMAKLAAYGDKAWMSRNEIRQAVTLFTGGVLDGGFSGGLILPPVEDPKPEFWLYYGATDWVAFYQLWGKLVEFPERFPKWFRELKQFAVDVGNPKFPAKPKDAHNALADARWARDTHAFLVEHRRVPGRLSDGPDRHD
jgi:hypothetical protein